MSTLHIDYKIVNKAFSKQAEHYDEDDATNPILSEWRQQVYDHVNRFIKPCSLILELNAGTGLDAVHFAKEGHRIHAIDLSDGMVEQLRKKEQEIPSSLTCQQLSFEELHKLFIQPVDYIYSNFGGLNCTNDLGKVTKNIPALLKPNGYLTWVIMPPVSFWEWLWVFKGYGRKAFRRFKKNGDTAHLEGEFFQTYYYSATDIRRSLGGKFRLISCEGLGIISPPPSKAKFPLDYPRLYRFIRKIDKMISRLFPFNRWADHIIITFQYNP